MTLREVSIFTVKVEERNVRGKKHLAFIDSQCVGKRKSFVFKKILVFFFHFA